MFEEKLVAGPFTGHLARSDPLAEYSHWPLSIRLYLQSTHITVDRTREGKPSVTAETFRNTYLHAKWRPNPANRLATIHQRYKQAGQTDRQPSDSIGRTCYDKTTVSLKYMYVAATTLVAVEAVVVVQVFFSRVETKTVEQRVVLRFHGRLIQSFLDLVHRSDVLCVSLRTLNLLDGIWLPNVTHVV